jgi:DNA-binding NarL/FixJ family response regulator
MKVNELIHSLERLSDEQKEFPVVFVNEETPDISYSIDKVSMTINLHLDGLGFVYLKSSESSEPSDEINQENTTRVERNKRIMEMSKAGYSQKEIANTVGLHFTTVSNIIKKMSK